MYTIKRTLTTPSIEPVTLAEMKTFILNRYEDDSAQDAILSDMIKASRELAETWSNRSLIPQTIEYEEKILQSFSDSAYEITLPFPNHLAIVEVKVDNQAVTDYELSGLSRFSIQFLSRYFTTDQQGTKYYIKYTAGDCGLMQKSAIMQICKDMWENRGKDPMSGNGYRMCQMFKSY